MDEKVQKLTWVDALRGIAVIGVVLVHTGQFFGLESVPEKCAAIISDGSRGVSLFYILSAFTLFYTFSFHSMRETNPLKNFFTRRFFRIVPLFFFVLVGYFVVYGWGCRYQHGQTDADFLSLITTITFTNSFVPHAINNMVPGGWSIAIEMVFYCMVPFLFRVITTLNRWVIALGVALLLKGVGFYLLNPLVTASQLHYWQEYRYFYLPTHLPIFMMGILLYLVVIKQAHKTRMTAAYVAIGVVLFLVYNYFGNIPFLNKLDTEPASMNIALFFVPIIVAVRLYSEHFGGLTFLAWIGKLSYSIYLLHYAVLSGFAYFGFFDVAGQMNKYTAATIFCFRFAVVLATSIAVSMVTYHYIERPCIAFGGRIIAQRERGNRA